MIGLLEVGIEPCNPDNASELMGPYFGASALRMEVSESNFCLQLQFDYQASGPLVQNVSPAKSVLNVTTTFDLVFSSDRSSDRFTGKPVSQTTGLYYEYARWYDPSIGRFINEDPLAGYLSDPQSLNPYVYSGNTPTTLTDPSGMSDSGGFLGAFDTYVSRPYLSWFNQNVLVPTLTFETGGNQAAVEAAVNQNAGLENTLFDSGVVAGAVVATAAIVAPFVVGTTAAEGLVTTGVSGCTIEEGACQAGADALAKDLVDLGSTSATTEDLVSTSRFWSTTERGGFDFGDSQIHHLLPRQFGAFFERAGIENIDDYTVQLDRGVHMVLHGRGGLYAESWNPAWRLFLLNNPNADSAQILYYLKTLVGGFGF